MEINSDHDAMLAIQELLSGVEWDVDTLGAIAEIMVEAGYAIDSVKDDAL